MAGVWDALAECICRPPRDEYDESQLFGGRGVFSIGGVECCRCDFEIVNARGQTLKASHYLPLSVQGVAGSAGGARAGGSASSSSGGGGGSSGGGRARDGGGGANPPAANPTPNGAPSSSSSSTRNGGGGPLPCVVYCHCNSGSRRDAEEAVVHLLPMGVGVLAFDAAGSGLSDGDWVTLGAREAEDLACVVKHLRASGAVSTLAVWGRSMGAVTALLFAARADAAERAGLCAVVCDSPFARLSDLILEIIRAQRLPVPGVLLKGALALMRGTVRRKAGFDLREASPLDVAPNCRVPCVFGHALADSFIPVSHSERLAAAYGSAAAAADGADAGAGASGVAATAANGGSGSGSGNAAATTPPVATTSPFATASATTNTTTTTTATTTVYRNLIRFGGDHNHVRPPLFYASVCCFLHVHLRLDEVLVGGNPLKGLAQAAAALQRQHEREEEARRRRQAAGQATQPPGGGVGGAGDGGGAFSRGNSAVLPDDNNNKNNNNHRAGATKQQQQLQQGRPPRGPPPATVAVPVPARASTAEPSPSNSSTTTSGSPLRRWWSRNASLRRSSTSGAAGASANASTARAASPQKHRDSTAPLNPAAAAAAASSVDLGDSAAISEDVAAAAAAEAAMRALGEEGGGGAGAGGGGRPAFGLQMMPSGAIDRAGGFTSGAASAAAPGSGAPGQGLDPHQQLAQALHHAVQPTTTSAASNGAGRVDDEAADFERQLSVAIERSLREARACAGGAGRQGGDDEEDREVLARVLDLSLQEQEQNQEQAAGARD